MNMKKLFPVSCLVFCLLLSSVLPAFAKQRAAATPDKKYAGYLFVYFTGNDIAEESVHYAVSAEDRKSVV